MAAAAEANAAAADSSLLISADVLEVESRPVHVVSVLPPVLTAIVEIPHWPVLD